MEKVKIALGSDHGGLDLKNKIVKYLAKLGYETIDYGTNSYESCDYPIYARYVAEAILKNECQKGILVCGTGLGMQITANRYKNIRAVCVSDEYSAKMSREHNNSNILTLGQRVVGEFLAYSIIDTWLNTEFLGERHQRRVDMLDEI